MSLGIFRRTCLVVVTALTVWTGWSAVAQELPARNAAGWSALRAPSMAEPATKVHPRLLERLDNEAGPAKTWVFFTDKGLASTSELVAALNEVAADYNPRAVYRRMLRGATAARGGPYFDEYDLPVVPAYVQAVTATGAQLHVTSRWLNAVSVYATRQQVEEIAALTFVDRLEPVARSRRVEPVEIREAAAQPAGAGPDLLDYGNATAQLNQINLIALHNAGYTGAGVIVGILDTGFKRTHEAFTNPVHPVQVIAEWDFVKNDPNTAPEPGDPSGQHDHGTMILGTIGAYKPTKLVGGAFDAAFILCKTEDTAGEYPAEEDNFVAGLELIELHGGDMSTASLGYIDWYTQAQLNGQTAVTTIGVNISTAKGIHHCNAAGNEGHDSNPQTSHLIAPADAFKGITCGAVNSSGSIASFSSDGPTADGRVKPEVLARGVSTATVSPSSDTGYTTASGTSLSTPLVACAVACLIQAKPYWTVDQMRKNLFETADYYVANHTFDPLYVRGYGVIDAFAASKRCSDAGTVVLNAGRYACESVVHVLVNDCGLNLNPQEVEQVIVSIDSTSETGVEQVVLTETDPDSAEFTGSIPTSAINSPGVLLVAHGDQITVTYLDADNGQGQYNVVVTATAGVDCMAPAIQNVTVSDITSSGAKVTFEADEPVRAVVYYGLGCGALTGQVATSNFVVSPVVQLSGLTQYTRYYFAVEAQDSVGNKSYDDNHGACYAFRTRRGPQAVYRFPLDSDPGWSKQGQWAFGRPTGGGGAYGGPDPTTGHSGTNVYGYNLNGDYTNNMPEYHLTSGPLDCSGMTEVTLRFWRWLGVERSRYDHAYIRISTDGVNWTKVWENPDAEIADTSWTYQQFDISAWASNKPAVYLRWTMGPTDSSWTYCGWNLDDIEVWATLPVQVLLGDVNCDGLVDLGDINPFVLALTDPAGYQLQYPDCPLENRDINGDGRLDFGDINPFVRLLTQP